MSADWQQQDRYVVGLVEDRLNMTCFIKVCMLKPIFKCCSMERWGCGPGIVS